MLPPSPTDPPRKGDDGVRPSPSDASLRAALAREQTNIAELRQLSEHQRRLLRRRSVRVALALDSQARVVRDRARAELVRARRRTNRLSLAVRAVPERRLTDQRRRHLEEAVAALPPPPTERRRVTLVVLASEGPATIPDTDLPDLEVIVAVARGGEPPDEPVDAEVVRATHKTAASAARDALSRATGELVCLVRSSSTSLEPGWLARLCAAVTDDVVAAAPLLVHPERPALSATPHDLMVRSLGLDIVDTDEGGLAVAATGAGERPNPLSDPFEVAAGSGAGLVVRLDAYREAGGLAHIDDLDPALVDLCGRLRVGGARVVAVPSSVLVDNQRVPSIDSLTHPVDHDSQGWQKVLARRQATLTQLASHRPVTGQLLVRMTVAAPSARVAHRWGDWHLAEGLGRSLRRKGHSVHLRTLGDDVERFADIDLVLRGASPVPRVDPARRVLWVISHPENLEISECDEADLVVVASDQFAATLRDRTSTPVEVLHQATDPERFTRRVPVPEHSHAVAIVAMTRHVFRPSVRYALDAGLRPAIYGSDWREFVDPGLIAAPFVHNHHLPTVYSSVGLLLNDHWDAMRAWGFISNRLYDSLACGTPIISDHMPEIDATFDGAVRTYTDAESLRAAVDLTLDDPVAAHRRADEGRRLVLARHTFDHRADELLALMARHGLVESTP
jgi:hypothetical protein